MAEKLQTYLDRGRARWSSFDVDAADVLAHLHRSVQDDGLPTSEHAADWYLACACALGDSTAIKTFCAEFDGVIMRVARRSGSGDQAEDLRQSLLEKLLFGSPKSSPKIAQYRGRSDLRSWVAATAASLALTYHRAANRRRQNEGRAVEEQRLVAGLARDPSHELFRVQHREMLGQAIREALASLPERERTLLRLQVGQGMTIDQIAALYRVNRATSARWLVATRERVCADAREILRRRLGLQEGEISSVFNLISNILEISVLRHLT